ncbi:MAG: hypothetical protein M1834_004835 [Cirrosporium novae-zelandiae]|nr:MAG: hypothetical protein M1834_004835 [Cirrosporium novae-zelandiae]
MPASISLLTLPLELQVEILKYLPLTALLTLKQVNRGLHNLILEEYEETRPEKISSVAIWEYLCFAERWPDLDPEQREPVLLKGDAKMHMDDAALNATRRPHLVVEQ